MSNTTNKCFFLYTYLFNFVCPYIVDWSMRDEMSGMPKKISQQLFFDANVVSPVCLTFIVGFVTLQCHFNQPRPFSHYRAKEASDFDGHRFHKMLNLRREILYYSTSVFSPILSNDKTFLVKINLYQRLT